MKLTSKILGLIIFVVIFGGIAASSALGYWNTENAGGGGQAEGAGLVSGEGGSMRGKTTFQDLLNLGLPQGTIEQVIGGPMPSPLIKVKDYCAANGLEFEAVKEALQAELDKLDG